MPVSGFGAGRPVVLVRVALVLVMLALFWPGACRAEPAPSPRVAVIELEGAIGPATAAYVVRSLQEAARQQDAAVVLRLDTPGGLDSAMRGIIRAMLTSPVPVIGYVAPGGARAASAGRISCMRALSPRWRRGPIWARPRRWR